MIDIIFALVMLVAIIKGYQRGLIVALFSIIAFIVGLAAALKLSAAVAVRLQDNITVSSKWLPVISFALVFFVVVLLVHLGAKLIQKTFEMAMLGWANRIGGILLYIVLYTIIFSIFLFYAEKIKLLSPAAIAGSVVYPMIQPIGPKVIEYLAKWLPALKDSFLQLEAFFERVSNKIQH
jgi:membrane protein required for colicin V production